MGKNLIRYSSGVVSIPERVLEALKPPPPCLRVRSKSVSIPERVLEALKPPALEKYIIFGFQGTNARTIAIVADLAQLKQNHT